MGEAKRGSRKASSKKQKHSPGDLVNMKNGAVAQVQDNGQWRIVYGPPGGVPADRRARRKISVKAAKRAFNKYYRERKGTDRGNKIARSYDIRHTNKRVVDDSRYLQNPHRFDFQGVDTGDVVRKPRSAAQLANDARLRGMSKEQIFGQRGGLRGGQKGRREQHSCGVNDRTGRCSKRHAGNQDEMCVLRKRTNRCA